MASQSGIFSHSLYGGPTNGNMLRFDDKTGAEEVKFHAEKDLNTTVKNNETHTVNADRTKTIIHNEITKVHIDRTEEVFVSILRRLRKPQCQGDGRISS